MHTSCLPVWRKIYTVFLYILSLLLWEERFSIEYCVPRSEQWHLGILLAEKICLAARYLQTEINRVKNCGGAAATTFALLVLVR